MPRENPKGSPCVFLWRNFLPITAVAGYSANDNIDVSVLANSFFNKGNKHNKTTSSNVVYWKEPFAEETAFGVSGQ